MKTTKYERDNMRDLIGFRSLTDKQTIDLLDDADLAAALESRLEIAKRDEAASLIATICQEFYGGEGPDAGDRMDRLLELVDSLTYAAHENAARELQVKHAALIGVLEVAEGALKEYADACGQCNGTGKTGREACSDCESACDALRAIRSVRGRE